MDGRGVAGRQWWSHFCGPHLLTSGNDMGHRHSRHDDGGAAAAAAYQEAERQREAAARQAEEERQRVEAARKAEEEAAAKRARVAEASQRASDARRAAEAAEAAERARLAALRAAQEAESRRVAERAAAESRRLDNAGLTAMARARGSRKQIAVVGTSGVGKSSLSNRLLVRAGGAARAPVGTGRETTMFTTPYAHPTAPLDLWDAPGAETDAHPGATYFTDKCLDRFHGLIICFTNRATEMCNAIIKEAQSRGIPHVIVCTKADQGMADVAADHGWDAPVPGATTGPALDELRRQVAATATAGGWASKPLLIGRLPGGPTADAATRGAITVDGPQLLAWLAAQVGVPAERLTAA